MWCFRYKKKLMPYAEGALDQASAEQVKRHLDTCGRCREELSFLSSAVKALRTVEAPSPMEPAGDIWSRIRTEIEEEPTRAPFWRVRSYQAASAAVIGTTLLFFVLVRPMYYPEDAGIAERYSVQPPKVTDSARPQADRRSAQPPQSILQREKSSSELNFAEPEQISKSPSLPPPPVQSPVSAAPAPAITEERPLPASDYRQTQGVPGGSQLAIPQQSPVQNLPREQKGSSHAYQPQVAAPAPASPPPSDKQAERMADTRGGGIRSPASTVTVSSSGAQSELTIGTDKQVSRIGESIKGGNAEAKSGSAADNNASPRKNQIVGSYRLEKRQVSPAPKLPARTVVLNTKRAEYMRHLSKNPKDGPTIYELAKVEQQLGNKAAVVDLRKRLTELKPNQASLWVELGEAYEASGQPKQAYEAYKKALSLGLPGSRSTEVGRRLSRLSSKF